MRSKLSGNNEEHRYHSGVFSYIDENGEKRISVPADTHYVGSYAQKEAYKAEQESDKWSRGKQSEFTAAAMLELSDVYTVLTTTQCGYLMRLQCNVNYGEGILVNSNKSRMTTADMIRVLQLTKKRSTFYNFLSKCIDNDIIREREDGAYFVNPRYHFKGAFNDNQFVVKAYITKIKRVYREVKAADIGLIYRMLPFIHYETNALCMNPSESNPRSIEWFNRKELAEAIGVDSATLGRRLPNMKFDDEYVIARLKVGNEPERYTFNPSVFYRKNSEPDATLQAMFNVKRVTTH
jgi:hypothetical protein